ncbi:RHS repeat-associated core domain-containing protein, partial [Treponema sp. R6D11]
LHERIEYTPYGEIWVEHKYDLAEGALPYRFTGKELDEETGYYYYGARYLDPRTSRWISTDPAMGDYIPEAGNENNKLPNGGVYNTINLHTFHYSNNNPLKYTDPNGDIPLVAIGIVAVGIAMLPNYGDGFLYFDTWHPQYLGGYRDFYENFTSNNWACNIDSLRTNFNRADGSTASIWLWKGDYNMVFNGGWHTGAEIGVYNSSSYGTNKILKSASYSLKDGDGNVITSRALVGKWWTNSFVKGNGKGEKNGANGDPSSMVLSVTLEFNNENDAISYDTALTNSSGNTFYPSVNRDGSK